MVENIKKIVIITNNQVYNHHNKFLNFNAAQRKRIINDITYLFYGALSLFIRKIQNWFY
jgi:hypothetical protein